MKGELRALGWGLFASSVIVLAAGCGKKQMGLTSSQDQEINEKNLVSEESLHAPKTIGDDKYSFEVLRHSHSLQQSRIISTQSSEAQDILSSVLRNETVDSKIASDEKVKISNDKLQISIPLSLIGKKHIMGAVITKVDNPDSPDLGILKLAALTPVHVETSLAKNNNDKIFLVLSGCLKKCDTSSTKTDIMAFPVAGVDKENKRVLMDFAVIGKGMGLLNLMDPDGMQVGYIEKDSSTTTVDYSKDTLVFDVTSNMVEVGSDSEDAFDDTAPRSDAQKLVVVTRWFIKFDPQAASEFAVRNPRDEVGFFLTNRLEKNLVKRFALPSEKSNKEKTHYYLKNVPEEYKKSFVAAFAAWNENFKISVGEEVFSYEFVSDKDSKGKLIVAGDARYNVLEWDLYNKAPYGGYGPSNSNQQTGEIFSGNVLIQGPEVIEIYTKWFETSKKAKNLRADGRTEEADALELALTRQMNEQANRFEKVKNIEFKLANEMKFYIGAIDPKNHDPLMQRVDFDRVPEGYTFKTYMAGYFHDMVAHELGHNIGLRHNFRGNIKAKGAAQVKGSVSSSIMEYLGKTFRHLNDIGVYDRMAISYGYAGKTPKYKDYFCTDENKTDARSAPTNSAECSSSDATEDPFQEHLRVAAKALGLILNIASDKAPTWTVNDMVRELSTSVEGIAAYYASADEFASSWTSFSTHKNRPSKPVEIKRYVTKNLQALVCSKSIQEAIDAKRDADAKEATAKNFAAFKKALTAIVRPFGLTADDLACN